MWRATQGRASTPRWSRFGRNYLKPGAVFRMTKDAHQAVEALKRLIEEEQERLREVKRRRL